MGYSCALYYFYFTYLFNMVCLHLPMNIWRVLEFCTSVSTDSTLLGPLYRKLFLYSLEVALGRFGMFLVLVLYLCCGSNICFLLSSRQMVLILVGRRLCANLYPNFRLDNVSISLIFRMPNL